MRQALPVAFRSYAILALVCALSSSLPLAAARPTRSIPREPAHRLVLPPPSREHASHHAAPNAPKSHGSVRLSPKTAHLGAHSAAHAIPTARASRLPSRHAHRETSFPVANASTLRRVHAWQQAQSALAAHAAITAADRAVPSSLPAARAPQADPDALEADNSAVPVTLVTTTPELPAIQSVAQEAATPMLLPSLYDARGHLVVPPPLYGSHEVLLHQNQMADHDGLIRVRDDADLVDLRRQGKLFPIPASEALVVDERLPENRRFARPWTAQFLAVLARDFYASFHEPIQVNSAVRTVQFQQRLLRTNGNAAPAGGETASPHLTGQAVDIGKRGLTLIQLAWMRTYLQPLINQGSIDVEEEFQQSCFHISVYRSYLPPAPLHLTVAASRATQPPPNY